MSIIKNSGKVPEEDKVTLVFENHRDGKVLDAIVGINESLKQ